MKRLVRRYKIIVTWALTTEEKNFDKVFSLLWFVPWVAVAMLSFQYMPLLPALVLDTAVLAFGGSTALHGYYTARRRNIHNLVVLEAEWSGAHPDLMELEMKEALRTRARR